VNENIFPCKLSQDSLSLVEDAVQIAIRKWGKRSLNELQEEDHLSYACKKGPIQDEVIANLHNAFEVIVYEYKIYTEKEEKKAIVAIRLHVVGT
jgi:preprotein translocase subunit SecA